MSARGDTPRPPRFTSALLRTLLGRDGEFVLGDLEEEYGEVCTARGEANANRWYRRLQPTPPSRPGVSEATPQLFAPLERLHE